jgi:hypothetical protein
MEGGNDARGLARIPIGFGEPPIGKRNQKIQT